MIDTAIPDTVEVEIPNAAAKKKAEKESEVDGEEKETGPPMETLINFDKRRKEFEVLAQIKLLQGAAKAYHIEGQPRFGQWWESVLVLDEREAFELSCQIEPNLGNGNSSSASSSLLSSSTSVGNLLMSSGSSGSKEGHRFKRKGASTGSNNHSHSPFHRKNDSIDSRASSSSGSQLASGEVTQQDSSPPSAGALVSTRPSGVSSSASSTSSLPSLDASMASSGNNTTSK